jgi:6-phosphogluconolactonase
VDASHPINVYQSDAEAFAAAAELAAQHLGPAPGAAVALPGGRDGRGVMLALGTHRDLPWATLRWFWTDERCVSAHDPQSNVRVARDSLLDGRDLPRERIHVPPLAAGDAETMAARYAEVLVHELRVEQGPVFDLVLLCLGTRGEVAALMPGCQALAARTPVAAVAPAEVTVEPHVARITVTPPVLAAARHVLVVAVGSEVAAALAATMRDPFAPERCPAQLVRPSATVTWVVDRAAAACLLEDARGVD